MLLPRTSILCLSVVLASPLETGVLKVELRAGDKLVAARRALVGCESDGEGPLLVGMPDAGVKGLGFDALRRRL